MEVAAFGGRRAWSTSVASSPRAEPRGPQYLVLLSSGLSARQQHQYYAAENFPRHIGLSFLCFLRQVCASVFSTQAREWVLVSCERYVNILL